MTAAMEINQLMVAALLGCIAGVIEPRAGFIMFGLAIIMFLVGG